MRIQIQDTTDDGRYTLEAPNAPAIGDSLVVRDRVTSQSLWVLVVTAKNAHDVYVAQRLTALGTNVLDATPI